MPPSGPIRCQRRNIGSARSNVRIGSFIERDLPFERPGSGARGRDKVDSLDEMNGEGARGTGESARPTRNRGHERDVRDIWRNELIFSSGSRGEELVAIRCGQPESARAGSRGLPGRMRSVGAAAPLPRLARRRPR